MIILPSQFTLSYFEGKIYDDGTNKIMLHFKSDAGSQEGRDLLHLQYARMNPVRSKFAIPTDERVQVVGGFCNSNKSSFNLNRNFVLIFSMLNVPILSLNFTYLHKIDIT